MGDKIRITSAPQGEAPLEIREGWVGIVLEGVLRAKDVLKVGVLTNERKRTYPSHFVISIEDALKALSVHNSKAHEWWYDWYHNTRPSWMTHFTFDDACYKVES